MINIRYIQFWTQNHFEPILDPNDTRKRKQKSALCKLCYRIIRNTSISRLQMHRKSCSGGSGTSSKISSSSSLHLKTEPSNINPSIYASTFIDSGQIKYDNSDASLSEPEYDDTLGEFNQHYNTSVSPPPEKKTKIKSIKIEKVESGGPSMKLQSSIYNQNTTIPAGTSNTSHYYDNDSIDIAVAKFFYACQIPFETADTTYFKDFVKELRPGYRPPTSENLVTTLLDKVHDELLTKQMKNLKDESVLLIDSQENITTNTRNAVALLQSQDGQKIFLDSFNFSLTTENKEDFDEIVHTSLEISQQKYKTKVYATVSNLENGCSGTGESSSISSNIWHNNCNIYYGNLLAQDIIDKDLAGKVTSLLKDFKQSKNEKSLIEYGGRKIKLPSKLYWSSYRDSFEWLIENLENMKQVAADGNYNGKPRIEFTNKRLLFNNDFIENIKSHIIRLKPICDMIKKCEQTTVTLADATELWLKLDLPDDCQDSLKLIRTNALKKYALAANILHPSYRGSKLTNDQRDEGEMFIFDELNAAGLEDYQSFCSNGSSVFDALAQKGELTPKTFWGLASRKHQNLANLANKLMRLPAASGQNKRLKIFKENYWGNNIDLDLEQSKKLLFVQYSLKNIYMQ